MNLCGSAIRAILGHGGQFAQIRFNRYRLGGITGELDFQAHDRRIDGYAYFSWVIRNRAAAIGGNGFPVGPCGGGGGGWGGGGGGGVGGGLGGGGGGGVGDF